jgi:hypothetical protein
MSFRFDATLKDLVAAGPADFAAAFGLPADGPVVTVNVDLSTLSAAADVALGFGQPIREIADVEFQSGPDRALPRRLLLYSAVLHHRYDVPVRSVVILLHERADSANLTGTLTFGEPGNRLEFDYAVVRLWREPVERFLHGSLSLLPIATLCELPYGDLVEALEAVVREIDRRLQSEADAPVAKRLLTATQILASLRVRKRSDLASIFQRIGIMYETTAWDEAIEEGEVRGQLKLLLALATDRFGPPDAESESELAAIRDLNRMCRLAIAVQRCNSWQELLANS